MAILSYENYSGSLFFDATEVDPFSVSLAGAGVKRFGKDGEKAKYAIQDVNGDGLSDMVVQIDGKQLGLESTDTEAELMGSTNDSTPFAGEDAVEIQQRMCVRSAE